MPDHTTSAGDCFARIAKANGFNTYRSVYDHADNATKFPNPNQLEAGSTVKVPDKQMKVFDLPLDAPKKFRIVRQKTRLRVQLCQADVTKTPPLASAALQLGAKKAAGTTGLLELDEIDPDLTTATLKIVLNKPAAFAGPPATAPAVALQHPPAIVADDFDDPKTEWPRDAVTISWDLQVGHLEPHDKVRGVMQRLNNLGFACPVVQAEDADTRRAVKCYRRAAENKKPPDDTDAAADVMAHLKSRHDD